MYPQDSKIAALSHIDCSNFQACAKTIFGLVNCHFGNGVIGCAPHERLRRVLIAGHNFILVKLTKLSERKLSNFSNILVELIIYNTSFFRFLIEKSML